MIFGVELISVYSLFKTTNANEFPVREDTHRGA